MTINCVLCVRWCVSRKTQYPLTAGGQGGGPGSVLAAGAGGGPQEREGGRAGGEHLVPDLVGGGGSLLCHLEALPLEHGAGLGGSARGAAACNSGLVIFWQIRHVSGV